MRKWLIGAICAAFVVAGPESARAFSDGHELLKAAESESAFELGMFTMFVGGVALGVRDTVSILIQSGQFDIAQPFCFGAITYRDLSDVVRVWLRQQADLEDPPALLVVRALSQHFPCED